MAGKVPKGTGKRVTKTRIKRLGEEIYSFLLNELGISIPMLRAHRIDYRYLHYYFKSAPPWTKKKEEFIFRIMDLIKTEFPGHTKPLEMLSDYLELIREYRDRQEKKAHA